MQDTLSEKTGTLLAVCRLPLEGFSKQFTSVTVREFPEKKL